MRSCPRVRATIIAVVRGDASEADRLCLDQHLTSCPSCASERARWLLMARLHQPAHPGLSAEARARILHRLTQLPQPEALGAQRGPGRARLTLPRLVGAGALGLVAAVALVLVGHHGARPGRERPGAADQGKPAPARRLPLALRDARPGALEAGRAHITYSAGSELRILPGECEVELVEGELDVEVSPGGPGGFRVLTPRFTVQVIGTRFIVSLDRVLTVHGVVWVREPDAAGGRQLATLAAGQVWHLPPSAQGAPTSFTPPARSAPFAPATPSTPSNPSTPSTPPTASAGMAVAELDGQGLERQWLVRGEGAARAKPSASEESSRIIDRLLSAARTALAAGDTARARRFLAAALRDGPRARQRAMAELLGADALLGESRYDAAVSAYRSTMYRFAAYPEGETAAFALAELLSERGPRAQAEQALTYCLARYPKGRFSDEVEKKLASLRPAQGR